MQQIFLRALLIAFLALGLNQTALAHVSYYDISTSSAASGGYQDTFTTFGWAQGQIQPSSTSAPGGALATTDDVNWYSFSLSQTSNVTITLQGFQDIAGDPALLNPAFSLYSGQFVDQSFDVNPIIPLAPNERGLVNTAQSFTLTTDDANAAANLRTVDFLSSATAIGTGTAELVNFLLGPGDYTVIAGGNSPLANDNGTTPSGIITFDASPVPLPGAFWLMSSAFAGLGLFGRRKNSI